MDSKLNWKIAKWVKRHGDAKRSDIPPWVPKDLYGCQEFYRVLYAGTDGNGIPILSPDDVFTMAEADLESFKAEQKRKRHEFRDWLEPTGVIFATIISLISLVVSLITRFSG